uniref:peroxidase n=1 Tax=Aegilops tauschii TaxID=37682 RepID=M8CQM7_AEGTA
MEAEDNFHPLCRCTYARPYIDVLLGRRDGLTPASADLVFTIPAPSFDVPTLISSFGNRSLGVADLVALSGAHTFGVAHCPSFSDRFTPIIDANPAIGPMFAKMLKAKCAKDVPEGTVTQPLDGATPKVFDNVYYSDLINRRGLLKSDQGLIDHPDTKGMATRFARNQLVFFAQFAKSMLKMSTMDVLTGSQGEIRLNCAVPNARAEGIETAGNEGHASNM